MTKIKASEIDTGWGESLFPPQAGYRKESRMREQWSLCEVQYVADNHFNMTNAEMGVVLGRSRNAVKKMVNELGFKSKVTYMVERKPKGRKFTPGAMAMMFQETAIC